ncbi:hypothetical protein, partial [Micromonospora sp. NPDC005413]|uniref:hypothetical protein n=1 Tax=Micromonospora sp. NPDC005413 TaxID=3154563 RepID=UPI0033B400EA
GVGRGAWGVGRGAWGVGRGAWGVGRGAWGVGREARGARREAREIWWRRRGVGGQDDGVTEAYPKQVSVRAATAARRQRTVPGVASIRRPSS